MIKTGLLVLEWVKNSKKTNSKNLLQKMKDSILEKTISNEEKIFCNFLEKGKPPFDYGNILLKHYKNHLESLFNKEYLIPYEIEIQPSSSCNANCLHCFGKEFIRLENKLYIKKNIDKVVKEILDLKQEGFPNPNIKFCGSTGDPLMNKNIGYFINSFYGKRKTRLFTNGLKIGKNLSNEKYLESLSKLNLLYLSLDAGTTKTLHKIKPGAKKSKVSVENILEGCKIMKSMNENFGVNVSYVISNKNYFEIPEATKKAKEYGMDLIRFRIDLTNDKMSHERTQEIIQLLKIAENYEDYDFKVVPIHDDEQIENKNNFSFGSKGKDIRCVTSEFWTCIGSDGNVYPCGHCVAPETDSFGNILKGNLKEIWNSKKRKEIQKNLPGKNCLICSPFSLRTNEFGSFLLGLTKDKRDDLLGEFYLNGK